MNKFEYLEVGFYKGRILLSGQDGEIFYDFKDGHSLMEVFNDLGRDGWEMVTMSLYQKPEIEQFGPGRAWFKRLLKE